MGNYSNKVPNLVSGALDPGQTGNGGDPHVQLADESATGSLHGGLKVHDLVGDEQLVVDHLMGRRQS